ncbi:hypothetical protein [Candidatus Liberibacter americanus]|uniref:Uncharacterized protein n=1 Tax=Candidatus Liberibacter americanus str. Sao Paulo TaxID=1261131 RepID=U6B4F8_9HYPH|nr:hypothetical protein [Candidatus Liberibacter americanus]AHA27954.1 hypothetical protein lam_607 [Candidatus Liberibacter americanus str. Sao Paulo]EMS35869.1 hypothetical protein G653_04536 [Candidatus Liberibacter americanus PW_SP]
MFQYRYFLLSLSRLKKCKSGAFVIVFVIFFSSFLTVADTIFDILEILNSKNNLDYICYKSLSESLHSSIEYMNSSDEGRKIIIKKNIKKNLINNYPKFSKGDIDYIVNNAVIYFNEKPSVSDYFSVGLTIELKLKLRSFIFNSFIKKDTLNIVSHKKLSAKYNISLLVIPFRWIDDNLNNNISRLNSNIRYKFFNSFFPNIEHDRLCIAPYDYDYMSFWGEGAFTYYGLQSQTRLKGMIYRAYWDVKPYRNVRLKLLGFKHNGIMNHSKANDCFFIRGHTIRQVKLMLIVAEDDQFSYPVKFRDKLKLMCNSLNDVDGTNGGVAKIKQDIIKIFSLGISPDDYTRDTLRMCSGNDRYFEINEHNTNQEIKEVSNSLGLSIINEINKRVHLLVR